MKPKVSPAIVGFFVLGALLIGIVALFSFGGVHFFDKPQRFVVYFDESIHGLDLGSPVKLRGVRVGRVTAINIRYEQSRNRSIVGVVCELSRDTVRDENGGQLDVSSRDELQRLIDRGLRAQLGVIGLATGMLYVELDFYDPKENPVPPDLAAITDSKYVLIPPVPSAISAFQGNLTEILNDVKRINFASIGSELQGLIVDTRKKVNAVEIKDLLAQWTEAGRSVQELAASPEVKTLIVNLNAAASELRTVLAKIDGKIDPTADQLNATLGQAQKTFETFNATATTLRDFVAAQQHLGGEAGEALIQLSEAASAVQQLADFLERNPSALISGRKAPTR